MEGGSLPRRSLSLSRSGRQRAAAGRTGFGELRAGHCFRARSRVRSGVVSDFATTSEEVTSAPAEIQRIMRTGTIWAASGALAPALALGPLISSGWRPTDLALLPATAWWLGVLAAAIGLALLVWAACPVLGYALEEALPQKIFSIRVGVVLNLSGMALAGLAVLLSPGG